VNKKLLSLLVVVVVLASATLCVAQETKPVVTVSFSGYDALRADAKYLGQIVEKPELAQALEGIVTLSTQGKGLQGLDAARPWGAVVYSKGEEFSVAVLLPTTDIKALAETLGSLNFPATEQGDGTYEVQTPLKPLVMKEQNGWALLADQAETLEILPDDPMTLLNPLAGKYDLGVMAHVANLPDAVRQMIIAQIGMGAAMGMQQQPGESDEQYTLRRAMTERSIQQLTTLMNELDRFLLGISVDAEAGTGVLDVAVSAKEGTKTAEQFALLKDTKTDFAGFDQPEAAVSALWSSKMTEQDVEQLKTLLDGVQASAAEELAKQPLGDEEMVVAKELMTELFAVLEENIDARVAEGGAVVQLGPDQLTVVAGTHVADGPRIETLIKQFVDQLVKEQPGAEDHVHLDAETHEGVNMHMLSVPTEEMDEGAEVMQKLVGTQLDLIVGIGPKSLYLAAGRDAASNLKQVIDASKAAPGKAVTPVKIHVALEPIINTVAAVGEDESARQIAGKLSELLSQSEGKDQVKIETRPIPNGSMTRITLDEGVLRLIGSGALMAQQMMGAGGPPADMDGF